MAAPTIQLFINDSKIRIGWKADKSHTYGAFNIYWDTDSGMAAEAVLARNIPNVASSFVGSDKYIFYTFKRSDIGLTDTSEFYVRLKGVFKSGGIDNANPGQTKLIPSLFPSREEYDASQIYGWDYNKDLWKRIKVNDDGSLAISATLQPGDSGLGAVEIKDYDSETRANVTDMGSGDGALDVNLVGAAGLTGLDIQIGAIEIKDVDSDLRANVETVGAKNALDVNMIGVAGFTGLDIQIGAIEIKDADSDLRANVRDIAGEGALDVYIAGTTGIVEQYSDGYNVSGDEKGNVALGYEGATGTFEMISVNGEGEPIVAGYDSSRDALNTHDVTFHQRNAVDIFTALGLTTLYQNSSSVDCSQYGQIIAYVNYTKGTETSLEFKFQFSPDGSTWFDQVYETLGSPTTVAIKEYQMTSSSTQRIVVPTADLYVRMTAKGSGTVSGTLSVDFVLGWS